MVKVPPSRSSSVIRFSRAFFASSPILNPPQSGILGLHKIEKRAVVLDDDRIVARPMMFVALSYDHRIVDGREAVSFLVKVKEGIEDPERLLLEV